MIKQAQERNSELKDKMSENDKNSVKDTNLQIQEIQ